MCHAILINIIMEGIRSSSSYQNNSGAAQQSTIIVDWFAHNGRRW